MSHIIRHSSLFVISHYAIQRAPSSPNFLEIYFIDDPIQIIQFMYIYFTIYYVSSEWDGESNEISPNLVYL